MKTKLASLTAAAILVGSIPLSTYAQSQPAAPADPINVITPFEDVSGKTETACPKASEAMVIVAFGQSNSSNHLDPRQTDTTGQVYNFFQGKCYVAADPMLGASGRGGSIWVPFGQKLAALTHKKIVISSFGVGGSTIQRWEDKSDLEGVMDRNLTALKHAYAHVPYFFWVQGESDVDDNPPAYGKTLVRVAHLTKQYYPDSTFALSSTSYCDDRMNPDITAIQKQIATSTAGMLWLGDTDQFRSADYRRDNCHLNGKGIKAVVDEFIHHLTPKLAQG